MKCAIIVCSAETTAFVVFFFFYFLFLYSCSLYITCAVLGYIFGIWHLGFRDKTKTHPYFQMVHLIFCVGLNVSDRMT